MGSANKAAARTPSLTAEAAAREKQRRRCASGAPARWRRSPMEGRSPVGRGLSTPGIRTQVAPATVIAHLRARRRRSKISPALGTADFLQNEESRIDEARKKFTRGPVDRLCVCSSSRCSTRVIRAQTYFPYLPYLPYMVSVALFGSERGAS